MVDRNGRAFVYHGGCDGTDADNRCADVPILDCDDGNPEVWGTPGEVRDLLFVEADTLVWSPPGSPGGTVVAYDTLRSDDPSGFGGAYCVESDDPLDTTATDGDAPEPGSVFHYLVRAGNACPSGEGSLGTDSDGAERDGRACP